MKITILHTIIRDDVEIEVEATGSFYAKELESFAHEPKVDLTEEEIDEINLKLDEAMGEDFDETKWESERELNG